MVGNVCSQSTKGHEGQKISTKGHEGTRRKTKRKKIPRTDASCPAPLVPRATRPRPASQGHSTPKNVSPTPLSGFANHGSPWGGDWWVFSRVGECGADHSRKNGRSLMKANHEWTRINTNRPEDRGPPSTTSGTKMVLQFCDLGVTVSWDDGFQGMLSRWRGAGYLAADFSECRRAPFGKLPFARERGWKGCACGF